MLSNKPTNQDAVLQDLDTDKPVLKDSNGQIVLHGTYGDTIGSVLVMKNDTDDDGKPAATYMCHTETKLKFKKPQ